MMKVKDFIGVKNRFNLPIAFDAVDVNMDCVGHFIRWVKPEAEWAVPSWMQNLQVHGWYIGYITRPPFPIPVLILYIHLPMGKHFPTAWGYADAISEMEE